MIYKQLRRIFYRSWDVSLWFYLELLLFLASRDQPCLISLFVIELTKCSVIWKLPRTTNDGFSQISLIFWPIGQNSWISFEVFLVVLSYQILSLCTPSPWFGITQLLFQQKAKIFVHFTEFLFRFGILIWAKVIT